MVIIVVVAYLLNLNIVKNCTENIGVSLFQLFKNVLRGTLFNLSLSDNKHCAVGKCGNMCRIDECTKRRCIKNNKIEILFKLLNHI